MMPAPYPSSDELRVGGKRQISRVLSRLETHVGDKATAAFLDDLCLKGQGHVLGLTGPPGVGKSTLTDALIKAFRSAGESVAVLAIDPSSSVTGGALLGDRTRLTNDPEDDELLVRSMAARDRLGGLSDHSVAAIVALRAVYDRVIVETVGIGQSEGDLKQAVDTVILCIQPGSGDSLQFMKAGIMELPDIVAVTKADMGELARRAASDVTGALSLSRSGDGRWQVPVTLVSSQTGDGVRDLVAEAEKHRVFLGEDDLFRDKRFCQHKDWVLDMVKTEFGQNGLSLLKNRFGYLLEEGKMKPFGAFSQFLRKMQAGLENGVCEKP